MQVIKPPTDDGFGHPAIFLAGTIEMGQSEDWQTRLIDTFADTDAVFYNPRRDDWDSSWGPDSPELVAQIEWELKHLNAARFVLMYLDPNTMSPVSLLELGILLKTRSPANFVLCCPVGFWRRANVEVTARWYGIPVFNYLDTAILELRRLWSHNR